MKKIDTFSGNNAVIALASAVRSPASEAASAAVDLTNYSGALVQFYVGVEGITSFDETNYVDLVIEHSDDGSTWTGVAADDINGLADDVATVTDGIVKQLQAAHAAPAIYQFGYVGSKANIRVKTDFAGTHGTGTTTAVFVQRSEGRVKPDSLIAA